MRHATWRHHAAQILRSKAERTFTMNSNRIYSIVRSKLFRGSLLAIFLFICVALLSLSGSRVSSQSSAPQQPPQANNEATPFTRMIENAKRSGRDFPTAEPFN